jgi:hypothetical protein
MLQSIVKGVLKRTGKYSILTPLTFEEEIPKMDGGEYKWNLGANPNKLTYR